MFRTRLLALTTLAAASIAGLTGCAGSAKVTDTLESGTLRLEQLELRSPMQFTVNSTSRVTYYQLRLSHRGQVLKLSDARSGHEQQEELLGQGWLLMDAPRPAALLATDRWWLVTEGHAGPQVQALGPSSGRWRWLDAPVGTPETQLQGGSPHLRTERVELALRGGKRLLLDEALLLDVTSLRVLPLAQPAPAGYEASGYGLISLAPDGSAAVFAHRSKAVGDHDLLLQVVGLGQPGQTLIPLDGTEYRDADNSDAVDLQRLVDRYLRWQPQPGGGPARAELAPPPRRHPWQLRYELGARARQPDGSLRPRLTLAPVRPSALAAAAALLNAPDIEAVPPQAGDAPANQLRRLRLKAPPVELQLRLHGQQLEVSSPVPVGTDAAWPQHLVRTLGQALEQALRDGNWSPHLARSANSDQSLTVR